MAKPTAQGSGKSTGTKEQSSDLKINDLADPTLYLNRELSLLEFQRRVLDEAKDERNPLLERIKFLSILDSNLEEFFMVRVGGLNMQKSAGVLDLSMDGLTPAKQLAEIRKVAVKLLQESREYFNKKILPELDRHGIRILSYKDLSQHQKELVNQYFQENIFPVLTPLAYDPGHPFPHISNLSLNLGIIIKDKEGNRKFARVKVPSTLPVLIPLKRSSGGVKKDGTTPYSHHFVWLSQLIVANLEKLFPGMEIVEAYSFHVTRNADVQIQELEALDLLETMEESVRRRRFGQVVRLLVTGKMPAEITEILQREP